MVSHVRGGRWKEIIPYARFLRKHSLWQAAGRQILSALPGRQYPPYSSTPGPEDIGYKFTYGIWGPRALIQTENPARDIPPFVQEAPTFFTKGWLSGDKEIDLSSARLGWVWQVLSLSPFLQTANVLWEGITRTLLSTEKIVETPDTAYSAAEQISNTILFYWILARSGEVPKIAHIKTRLQELSQFVSANMEYYGEGEQTNNHFLNNARGLYLSGVFLEREEWRKMARAILRNEVERSLTKSGFLREGSSSYHLLILRWFQEIERVAYSVGDTKFHEWVKAQVLRLREAARFFCPQPGNIFPLIGDVSPDESPEWLIPLIHGEDKGWNALWHLPLEVPPDYVPCGLTSYLGEGWARYDGDRYRLFWHVNPFGAIGLYSHAHHDTGSFSLQMGREEIFVDPGRPTYAPTAFGLYFKSASAHNLFVIGDAEPFVSAALNGTRLFLPEYSRAHVSAEASGHIFYVGHDGYRRFSGLGHVSRRFQMDPSRIIINDKGEGRGWHNVDTFFHLGPDVECSLSSESVLLKTKGGRKLVLKELVPAGAKLTIHRAGQGNSSLGWVSRRYGELCRSTTLRWRRRVKFPLKQSWVVEVL